MSVPMSMGPMLVMESRQVNGAMYHHGTLHHMQPGPPLPATPLIPNGTPSHILPPFQHSMQHHGSPSVAAPSSGQHIVTSSMNRSQRCGVCRGCQCKPCGQCTYCQDSPQFGGPGVKKQSCIERRCLRVLENRLQRDAPTFKARVGCNQCEDCRMPDCQICLVCLDKRFFDNRYMTGAMCAKKRCNNATSIELPAAQNVELRQAHKRTYEQSGMLDYQMMKRRIHPSLEQLGSPQQQQCLINMSQAQAAILNGGGGGGGGCTAPPGTTALYAGSQMRLVPPPPQAAAQQLLIQPQPQHPGTTTIAPTSSAARGAETTVVSTTTQVAVPVPNPPSTMPAVASNNNGTMQMLSQPQHIPSRPAPQQYIPQLAPHSYLVAAAAGPGAPSYLLPSYIEESAAPQSDPFTPPSYAPEMKNVVVLQPL